MYARIVMTRYMTIVDDHSGNDRKIIFDEFGNPVVDNSPYSVDK